MTTSHWRTLRVLPWLCGELGLVVLWGGMSAAAPAITSPAPGSTLPGASVTFQWSANGAAVQEWWLYLGTSQGAHDVYDSGSLGTRLSTTVSGLPTDGRPLFARLWYRQGTDWPFVDAQYTAASGGGGTPPITEEEFVGPFPSWANVKTRYGAKGDGVTDDTTALQNALNDVGQPGKFSVLYLPAGTYKITNTLRLAYRIGVSVIGEHPDTTTIKWAGPADIRMFHINGVAYSRFNRLTFDGSNSAYVAVDQSYDNTQPHFDTGNEYADDVFMNTGYCLRGGNLGYGFAEVSIMRSKFLRCYDAAIITKNFNALDVWVWHSVFETNNRAITNNPGAGNWHVYNSLFKNSTVTDLETGNTENFSARHNTSINSKKFLLASGSSNPSETTLQGNTIIDPLDTAAIAVNNQGPLLLLDNTIRSRSGAAGAVVSMTNGDSETMAIGNTFTVSSPIAAAHRFISIDNTTVPLSNLSGLGEPTLPSTPQNMNRQVFEVPVGASAATIQQKINEAVSSGSRRPVVHIPGGTYNISTTMTIPANSDVQLVGDGYIANGNGTWLQWSGTGSGPVLKINGPTKATLRDIGVSGNSRAEGIVAEGIDQAGSRVFMHQAELRQATQHNLLTDGLDYTMVDLRNFGSIDQDSGVGVKVIGGPLANAGTPTAGRTNIFSGLSASNVQSYTVANGGTLLIRDAWYETGSAKPGFIDLTTAKGTLTIDTNRLAPPIGFSTPAIGISGFSGKATLLQSLMDGDIVISGDGSQAKVLGLGMVGINWNNTNPSYFSNSSSPATDARLLNSRQKTNTVASTGSIAVANVGTADATFIKDMLAHTRGEKASMLTPLPDGVTDLRVFRVWVEKATVGIHLLPAKDGPPPPPPSDTTPLPAPANLRLE